MSPKREIPWPVRVAALIVLVTSLTFVYGMGSFFEWLARKVRR